MVLSSLDGDKAEDIVVIDLAGRTSIADHMVIATGTSQRQIAAIAEHIQRRLKGLGVRSVSTEGVSVCDWVLIDAGDVLIHVFRPEVRTFYALERLWSVSEGEAENDSASTTRAN